MANAQHWKRESRERAIISSAASALAEAKTLEEFKQIRDKAEAVRHYLKGAKLGFEILNHAAELKLRAERKAGEVLGSLGLKTGRRSFCSHREIISLADLGIDRNQSFRWQQSAEEESPGPRIGLAVLAGLGAGAGLL